MSAFAFMMATVHADPNFGTVAQFRRPPGAWTPVIAVVSRPSDAMSGLGGIGARAGSLTATILTGDVAPLEPQRGDELQLDGSTYRIDHAAPDPLRLSWRLVLAEG